LGAIVVIAGFALRRTTMIHSKRQWAYLCLALLGLIGPWYFNISFMLDTGFVFDIVKFIRQGFVNDASSSLLIDVFVAAVVFCIWVIHETNRLKMTNGWIYIVLTWTVAFAFALPLFLYVREYYLPKHSKLLA
jgi:hypothetical protein